VTTEQLQDLACRLYELVRPTAVRNRFCTQAHAYIAERRRDADYALHLPVETELPMDEDFQQRTLAEKYAILTAHHDNTYPNDSPIMPLGNTECDTEDENREIVSWCALKSRVQDGLPRCPAFRADGWYNDVLADLREHHLLDAPGNTPPPPVPPAEADVWPAFLSASDIARRLGQPAKRVDTFLRRFARNNKDCRVANDNAHRNEPRHLYRTADVRPALERQLPRWQG
jgi:hypothetical protein